MDRLLFEVVEMEWIICDCGALMEEVEDGLYVCPVCGDKGFLLERW